MSLKAHFRTKQIKYTTYVGASSVETIIKKKLRELCNNYHLTILTFYLSTITIGDTQ